ncbi:T9SS type A sorting domain-containing protein [Crocinitomix algicola]|uniref:T9SS type A sorting domain-containing protein n=1 Tax=Crocinitomix algicola TaxID=1740263 RepID=UPI00087257C7|nr:T9SS type A sorting domain-containing protein [Crocinitomix algicola]
MKKLYLGLSALIGAGIINAQDIDTGILEGNNVRATISNSGTFFNDQESSAAGYEFPKDGLNHLIYSMSFWFGGYGSDGVLRLSADGAGDEGRDTYPGAILADGTAEAPEVPFADEVYLVSQDEIDYHYSHAGEVGYEMPHGIANWPGNGDAGIGLASNLAPFYDMDGDGLYEPETGEHPIIRGDYAAYLIMNDRAGIHTDSGGESMGLELHFMFYQYESEDDINNTTFLNLRVINRWTMSYSNFITGIFMDGDIGYASDDFVGSDSTNNMIFQYNGDMNDEGGYGEDAPAVGVKVLNKKMNVGGYFESSPGVYGAPVVPLDYWNYMNAKWKNGTPFRYGGNGHTTATDLETNYLYNGKSIPAEEDAWTEENEGNLAGDRRSFLALEGEELGAGEEICYDFAIINAQGGNNYENRDALSDVAMQIQAFYDEQPDNSCVYYLGIEEKAQKDDVLFYPNPNSGQFTVEGKQGFDLKIFSMDGRIVYEENDIQGVEHLDLGFASGTYVLSLSKDSEVHNTLLVIE